jgi:hypothetical protein
VALFALTLLNASCGGPPREKVHPVGGKVLYNGQPAAGATVVFHPKKDDPRALRPIGKVGADGTFTLTTYAHGDGAPAGDYAVVVIWPPAGARKKVGSGDRLGGRYGTPAASPLRARVDEGKNEFPPFELR